VRAPPPAPVRDRDGRVVAAVSVVTDISERARAALAHGAIERETAPRVGVIGVVAVIAVAVVVVGRRGPGEGGEEVARVGAGRGVDMRRDGRLLTPARPSRGSVLPDALGWSGRQHDRDDPPRPPPRPRPRRRRGSGPSGRRARPVSATGRRAVLRRRPRGSDDHLPGGQGGWMITFRPTFGSGADLRRPGRRTNRHSHRPHRVGPRRPAIEVITRGRWASTR
jgi:hypothetical protein